MSGSLGSTNISLSAAESLYGNGATQLVTVNDTNLKYLAGIPQSSPGSSISFSALANSAFVATSAAGASINVYTTATAAGWNGTGPLWFQISGNTYSSGTGSPSVSVGGNFPKGLILQINSDVYVVGHGGSGGSGGNYQAGTTPSNGSAGGTAIAVSGYSGGTFYINNLGTIAGGGGGGGGGRGGVYYYGSYGVTQYIGGTGGGGCAFGTGGNAGTLTTGGAGGAGGGGSYVAAKSGGAGGGLASAGASGGSYDGTSVGGSGGAAGPATTGTVAASAVWINTGTRLGTVG